MDLFNKNNIISTLKNIAVQTFILILKLMEIL